MKIGVFDPYLDSLSGGEKYILTAASCLSKKHEVFIFWDDEKILNNARKKFDLDLSKVRVTSNIFSPKVPLGKRFIKSKSYDSILFLSDGSLPVLGCKLYVHFQFPVDWVKEKFSTRLKIRRAKKVICNSKFTKEHIDQKFRINSIVLYPPVDDFPKSRQKENIVLSVGRYGKLANGTSFKKQEFMIEAFKKLLKQGITEWRFFLVISFAKNNLRDVERLKKQIKGYPIEIFENLNLTKLKEIYQKSKIYWHAAGFGENLGANPELAEHFGITTVEAMKNGLVPVVIRAGGQKEIITDKKDGFLWDKEKQLIFFTKELIKNEDLLTNMARQAIKNSARFSQKVFCKQMNEVFIK